MLTKLRTIVEAFLNEKDLNKALKLVVVRTREALGVDCCSIYMADHTRGRFRLVATDGLNNDSEGKVTLRFGEGLVGLVGKKNTILNLANAQEHPNFKYIPEIGEEEFKSFLGVPINYNDLNLGVLIIQQKDSRQFDEIEESFLVSLSAHLSSTMYIAGQKADVANNSEPVKCTFGSGGIAIARGWVWQPHMELEQVLLKKNNDRETQVELFHQALFQLQLDIDSLTLKVNDNLKNGDMSNVFDSYQDIIEDSDFSNKIDAKIYDEGWSASSAVKLIAEEMISDCNAQNKKELSLAIRDLSQRLLSRLAHSYLEEFAFSEPVILLAEEITAALIAELPRERIAGIISLKGSANSIAAILAKNMNIPTLMGVDLPLSKLDRHLFILDGNREELFVDPPVGVITEYRGNILKDEENTRLFTAEQNEPAVTSDGVKINVELNAGLNFDKESEAVLSMIDGVGLYRTEVEFMMHNTFPTELEECIHYEEFLKSFASTRVRMRTMDVGGDKPLPYMPFHEANPFLGWRGIRISLDKPDLLRTQFRAMLKANRKYENLEIMLPMISSLEEVIRSKEILDQAYKEICEEYSSVVAYPKLGAMIEVPATMFLLEDLAEHLDFFSIGSNDLTQYTLAVDRNNPYVSKLYDCFNPAMVRVLWRLYRICVQELNRPLAMCGEMAGDPLGAILLISMGYRELSMNYTEIARIKYILRRVDTTELSEIFKKAIKLSDTAAIREMYVNYLRNKGLADILNIK